MHPEPPELSPSDSDPQPAGPRGLGGFRCRLELACLLALGFWMTGCTRAVREHLVTPSPVFPAVIRPLDASVGSVILVHERLRFVVLDYSLSSQPSPGTYLELQRGSNRVGRVRLSRWTGPTTAAADFVEGLPKLGDTARPE